MIQKQNMMGGAASEVNKSFNNNSIRLASLTNKRNSISPSMHNDS
jgi:hypothetical protein